MDIESVEALLAGHESPRRPLLVGHDPDFSELAAALIGVAELPLRKGTVIRIDLTGPLAPGAGILRWMLPPELLGSSS